MTPKTIVVPLDRSELAQRAVTVAAPLADKLGGGLVLVTAPVGDDEEGAERYLDAVAALAVDVPVDTVVVRDRPAADAIEWVVNEGPDRIVCMTTHGRGRFRWAVAGSIAEDVIRRSTRPLLLVGPQTVPTWTDPPGQVVLCTDGSPAGSAPAVTACDWAEALGCEMTLAYVSHPLDVDVALHRDEVITPIEKLVHDRGIPLHVRIERSSYVAGALLDVAEEPPATLMVMSAHGREGFARVALGSVTMGVLNSSSGPVLVIPPHTTEAAG
jgi:nucleotide-binding universal stress UspA family protein